MSASSSTTSTACPVRSTSCPSVTSRKSSSSPIDQGHRPTLPSRYNAHRERRIVMLALSSLDHPAAADLPRVPHTDALHHRAGPDIVADGAGHHGLHVEYVEGELQPSAPDLGRVAEAPVLRTQPPADL